MKQNLESQSTPAQSARCSHCNSTDLFTEEKPPHLGLYCSNCYRWQKWLPQNRPLLFMPWGKHRGTVIKDLPDHYLNWALENLELKKPLYNALAAEYERRGAAAMRTRLHV